MPNLYGVAGPNPPWSYGQIIGGADIALANGVETNVVAVVLNPVAISGVYIPVAYATLTIQVGATPITNLAYALRIGSGSDIISLNWPAWAWVANGYSTMNVFLPGTNAQIQNPGAATTINISMTATGATATAKTFVCYALARWERAFD